jgi:crotonobetainyl-CoA:carnitine CoA-transferase CaiB-like acyl-CoA transferase
MRPLEGIRVDEAAMLFAAPLAGMVLADFGAEVARQTVALAERYGTRA